MMGKLNITFILFFFLYATSANAYVDPKTLKEEKPSETTTVDYRADCTNATAQIDMDINNVRARLLNGGDVWWDLNNGSYFVPKAPIGSGLTEVSSIFAGAVWLGGLDPAGNIKMAAVQYRANGNTDFYSGPLDPITGLTDKEFCDNWDRFFRVYGTEIKDAAARWEASIEGGDPFLEDQLFDNVKYWPAKGNPFFLERYNFELPNTGQGLGSFWDENFDGSYNPLDGDFPIIEIRGCEPENRGEALELLPDEMTFWIYNDAGGPHNDSNGSIAIQMEIQVQAFAYATNDEINDMTFQRYKLINRAKEDIRDMYFAMWVDADLGCSEDDLIGCDVGRSLAYAYNLDALDGDSGEDCSTGAPTYGANIPIVGTDYFRGPLGPVTYLRENGEILTDPDTGDSLYISTEPGGEIDTFLQLGMSSFMYINRQNSGPTEPWTFDPNIAEEYYNYLRGFWRDGRPLTEGGCGFTAGDMDTTRYAFPGLPSRDEEWSMCSECSTQGDRRTLQASGPFLLTPGAVNELIIGVVWVPDLDYPCPDISKFAAADDLAQGLFDNCFNLLDGPDAPEVCAIELDREVILVLTNDTVGVGNNKFEEYAEGDPLAPIGSDDKYVFEGYKIYQLINSQVSPSEYDDIDKARLVQVVDINNGVTELVNWSAQAVFGQDEEVWIPETEVEATDSGIRHTFKLTDDQFADGDQTLINHKKYYFSVIAYAQNEWQRFNPTPDEGELFGQRRPYLEGRGNINVYTVIPRPIVYDELNASYGDGVQITRLSGVGVGGNFVQLADGQADAILSGGNEDGRIVYKEGAGPIEINIYNPLEVKNGTYKVRITGNHDDSGSVCGLEAGARWELIAPDGTVIGSEKTLDALNEQIIPQYGFSVSISQSEESGAATTNDNGVIGASLTYANVNGTQWYSALRDGGSGVPFIDAQPFFRPITNFLRTSSTEIDNFLDPTSAYSNVGNGLWYPYFLTSAQAPAETNPFPYYVSPAWKSQGFIRSQNGLDKLNNVDIIFTNDKSKWSRCIVVESNNQYFETFGLEPEGDSQTDMYDLRQSPSVNKEGAPDGEGSGMGWFPGYAIDVETGERLNVFFGENSYFNEDFAGGVVSSGFTGNGADMLFNPGDDVIVVDTAQTQTFLFQPNALYAGGHHMIFVTRSAYDGCESLKEQITESSANSNLVGKINVFRSVTWTSIPLVNADAMLSYDEGYIPNDLTVQLRIDNPYNLQEEFNLQVASACSPIGELPEYEFTIEGRELRELNTDEYAGALENVNVVPNPYYGYSAYETSQFTTTVKITNLPGKANITIYTLDGKFIKEFRRDEIDPFKGGSNPGIVQGQGIPDVEWDLKNFKGIPIASGVYLIHVVAPDLGEERTIKWFGVNRKFDPSGL